MNLVALGLFAGLGIAAWLLFRERRSEPRPPVAQLQARAGGRFRLIVEDRLSIAGRGIVLSGRIQSGRVAVGEIIKLRSKAGGRPRDLAVTALEIERKAVDEAQAGDLVGVLLKGLEGNDAEVGDSLEQD
jgi:translation elongation factor EF-Tu-like GTPase